MSIRLPSHKGSLTLTHNRHKDYYMTVAQAIAIDQSGMDTWVSEEEKQKAIETDECWMIQWYPETPIGFIVFCASTLEALLEHVNQ